MAAILKKSVKSPYICNRLTDFDEIWYSEAYWSLTADLLLKFRIVENPRWRRPPSWKITKIAIFPQRFDRSLWNLMCWCKMGPWNARSDRYKIRISQIQDGGRPPFWKLLNRHISATVWPILMKFCTITHMGPYSLCCSGVSSRTSRTEQLRTSDGRTCWAGNAIRQVDDGWHCCCRWSDDTAREAKLADDFTDDKI